MEDWREVGGGGGGGRIDIGKYGYLHVASTSCEPSFNVGRIPTKKKKKKEKTVEKIRYGNR